MKRPDLRWLVGATVLAGISLGAFSTAWAQTPPAWAYPPGAETGVAGLDAAIDAVAARDGAKLQAQFQFTPKKCDPPGQGGAGGFACAEGEAPGSLVPAFAVGWCQGSFLRRGHPGLPEAALVLADQMYYLYAVGRIANDSVAPGATHALYFGTAADLGIARSDAPREQWAVVVFADAVGIRGINTGCGATVAQRVNDYAVSGFLLAPRGVPGAPDVGSGHVITDQPSQEVYVAGLALVVASGFLWALHRSRGCARP